jgi:membrane protein YqaA with SNARE-associated domain
LPSEFLTTVGFKLRRFALALGAPGLFLVAIADSSFLSIPEANDFLIVILSIGASWERMLYYVSMTTLGSIIGCCLLYSVGRKGGEMLLRKRFSHDKVEFARRLFKKSGILTVLIPSLLPPPMPFKIFVISAGVFDLSPRRFVLAVLIGRTIRYSMWGILAVMYGEPAKLFMQRNIYRIGIILMIVFLIVMAAALIIKLLIDKKIRATIAKDEGMTNDE